MSRENEKRLPIWAQRELQQLRSQIDALRSTMGYSAKTDAPVMVERGSTMPPERIGFPASTSVTFAAGHRAFGVSLRDKGNGRVVLEVQTSGRMSGVLAAFPRAANVIWVDEIDA